MSDNGGRRKWGAAEKLRIVLALVPRGPAAAALSPGVMDQMLGGGPVCLSEGSFPFDCGGDCPAAQPCSPVGASTDCMKVIRSSYDICGGLGSNPDHNCSAKSTTENCGRIIYGTADPKTKTCALTACSSTPDPCGPVKVTTEVTPCEW